MFNIKDEEHLRSACGQVLGAEPDEKTVGLLLAYVDSLVHWNKAFNLTAIRDPQEMITRHLLDSISVLPWLKTDSLLDAGTGAGLPGLILAIMRPEIQVTLLDSSGKKVRFLRHIKRKLCIDNIYPTEQRLENFKPATAPSVIISRAFSSLAKFASAARHLLADDSLLFAMKGQYPHSEIAELEDWVQVQSVEKLHVPGLHEQRHLVMMSTKT